MEKDRIVLLLFVILASVNGKFRVVGPYGPVRAITSEDAMLECQLVPVKSVSSMLVRWFKLGLNSPVHVYINGEDDIAAQHKDYRGRTELFKDELTKGNISLRIQNITRSDQGEYICSVDDQTDSERFTIQLEVVGFGCKPWIQMKGYDINGIQLVCKSTGWFPEPKIEWISEDGHNLIQAETTSHWGSTGLVDVHSNIVIPRQSSNRLTCRVQNKLLKTEQEVTIGISGDFLPVVPVWLVSLLVAILVLIVAISAMIYWTVKHYPHMKELELWKFIIEHEWKRICECEVSVTLDVETAHPELEVSEDLKSLRWTETWRDLPVTGKRFTYWPCALGSEGFTSGRHYWEVEVVGNRGWSLGVASESVEREGWVRMIPEDGFWIIERVEDQFYINFRRTPLPVGQVPGKVGVYLSYESGTVSFYDADTKCHLHSFTGNKFTGKLYPFFGNWRFNQFLRICS